jgi:hypothetical protein
MKLKLVRDVFTSEFTLGKLYIDDVFFCYTVEDVDRLSKGEPKVFGKTAIPKGVYKVIQTLSPHFGKITPRLLNVPGFDGVLIHSGNTAADTEGCLIVGLTRTENGVALSRQCFSKLMDKIKGVIDLTIEIQ